MKKELEPLIQLDGIYGVIAASTDGIIIESATGKEIDEETAAALTARISKEVADKTGIKRNVLSIIKGENGYLIFIIKKDFVLGIIGGNDVNLGEVKQVLRKVADRIQGILSG